MNLVTNAAEAIGDAEGRIVVSTDLVQLDESELRQIALHAELPGGEYLRFRVSDNGSGMDAATVERIFDPFFTTKFTGRGLGMSAARGIISSHGGTIEIDSTVGEGTTFTVLLPRVETANTAEETSASSEGKAAERKLVLVVDDEPKLRSILLRRLQYSGYDVLEAADGQEAIDIISEQCQAIDCVLLDLSMPVLSGDEVQQKLHAMRVDLPIVLMSGFSEREVLKRFDNDRIVGSLQKPISSSDLLEAVRDAISARS